MSRQRALRGSPPRTCNAWEAYQRGLWHTSGGGNQELDLGAEYFQRAIALDPRFADPHAMLARDDNGEATRGGGRPLDEGLKLAELEARAALRLDATKTIAYAGPPAWASNQRGDVANALEQAEHAIAINPNDPSWAFRQDGYILVFARRSEAARSALGTALRLDPRGQAAVGLLHHLAVSHYLDGDYALAEAASRRSHS